MPWLTTSVGRQVDFLAAIYDQCLVFIGVDAQHFQVWLVLYVLASLNVCSALGILLRLF